jgi:hypothetical protein
LDWRRRRRRRPWKGMEWRRWPNLNFPSF